MPKFTESQKTFIYQAKLYEFKKMNRKLQNLKGMLQHRKMENIPNPKVFRKYFIFAF